MMQGNIYFKDRRGFYNARFMYAIYKGNNKTIKKIGSETLLYISLWIWKIVFSSFQQM